MLLELSALFGRVSAATGHNGRGAVNQWRIVEIYHTRLVVRACAGVVTHCGAVKRRQQQCIVSCTLSAGHTCTAA